MKKSAKNLGYQPLAATTGSASPFERHGSQHGLDRIVAESKVGARPAPADQRSRAHPALAATRSKPVASGQPAQPARQKDRFISLPEELDGERLEIERPPSIFEDLPLASEGARGRIAVYCLAENFDRKALEKKLKDRGGSWLLAAYPDVLHGVAEVSPVDMQSGSGDVFYFDYGVIVFWGLTAGAESTILRYFMPGVAIDPLPKREIDEFAFNFSQTEKPHISNDTFTINGRLGGDALVKLSISHALAQSTKLAVYESRVMEIVEGTRGLPELLASTGKVNLSRKEIAQIIGEVFLQKSAVNLLSTVLDVPDFFWNYASDAMQALYKSACDYLEYDTRVEVLNARFSVLEDMLDMLRDHQNNFQTARLEWIVIWLILIEVVVGLLECFSIMGWVGPKEEPE